MLLAACTIQFRQSLLVSVLIQAGDVGVSKDVDAGVTGDGSSVDAGRGAGTSTGFMPDSMMCLILVGPGHAAARTAPQFLRAAPDNELIQFTTGPQLSKFGSLSDLLLLQVDDFLREPIVVMLCQSLCQEQGLMMYAVQHMLKR